MPTLMLNILFTIVGNCFDIFLTKLFFDHTLDLSKRTNSFLFYITALVGNIILTINFMVFPGTHSSVRAAFTMLLSLTDYFILTLFYAAKLSRRILIVLVIQVTMTLSEFVAAIPFSNLLSGSYPDKETILIESVTLFTSKVISFFILTIFIMYWRKRIERYPLQYHISILLTPVISLFMLISMGNINVLMLDGAFIPFTLCVLLLINIINFYLLEYMLKAQQLTIQKEQLEKQFQMQQKHFDTLSTAYRSTRRIIHDTKKHALYVRSGIEQGKNTELLDSIDNFVGDLENSYIKTNTGNLPVDALVGYYSSITDDAGISFTHSLSIDRSKLDKLPDYDMCIILGNLLENAYNAAILITERHKAYIKLKVSTETDKLFIQVINSCVQSKSPSDDSYLEHGYGLKNIKNTVSKWNGQFTYSCTDHEIFRADIVIPLPLEQKIT